MSRSSEYSYELGRARRQEIYEARVRTTTQGFLERYTEQYEQMLNRNMDDYIPEEMRDLRSDLDQIRVLLGSDPTAARDVSYKVGGYIYSLWSLAESARVEFERAERMRAEAERERRKQAQNDLLNEYYRQVSSISPAVVHFASDELNKIRSEINSAGNMTVSSLQEKLGGVIHRAGEKAAEWKAKTAGSKKKEAVMNRIKEAESQVSRESIEDRDKANQFIERLQSLREGLANGTSSSESVEEQLVDLERSVDDTLITEEVRRQAVIGFCKTLSAFDFTVDKPQLVNNESGNYVKITARRPSGNQAMIAVDLHGKLKFKLDRYEGMTCLKDKEKINVKLEQMYSVKLSEERELWSNPDRLSKDADKLPSGNNERRNK